MAEPLLQRLNQLQLHGMAARYREWQSQQLREPLTAETLLLALIDAEESERQARSLRYQLRIARFPAPRDLASFQWGDSPVSAAQLQQLAQGDYLTQAHCHANSDCRNKPALI